MDKVFKVALCGCQGHVEKFGNLINSFPESETVVVWDDDGEAAKSVADNLGCPYTTDFEAVLNDFGVDGVIIVAENFQHKELVLRSAAAGKHIFLEKPLCVSTADAREMQAAVHSSGVKFYMTDPFVRAGTMAVKNLIEAGTLGDITGARFRLGASGRALKGVDMSRIYDKSRCLGGIMADVGGHMIHKAHYLFGKPKDLFSVLTSYTDAAVEHGVEENAVVIMRYENKNIVTLECSWLSGGESSSEEIYGTKGWASVKRSGPGGAPDIVEYQIGRDPVQVIAEEDMPEAPAQHVRYWVEMMVNDIPNEMVGVDPRSNSGVSIDNAVEFVEIIEAIYKSNGEKFVEL